MPRSFALGDNFETFINEQVASGRFNNASEVVRAGLRMLQDDAVEREAKVAAARKLIEEGRNSPVAGTVDEVFDRVEARLRARG